MDKVLDLALLPDLLSEPEAFPHYLGHSVNDIGPHVNSVKAKYISLNQNRTMKKKQIKVNKRQ